MFLSSLPQVSADSMAFYALALLSALPTLANGFTFDITTPPTQCGLLSLSLSNASGNLPYTAIVMPYGASVGQTEQRRVIQHQFSDTTTSFLLPYPGTSDFVVMVGDSSGPGSGGTSVPTSVGSSNNDTCLPKSVSALFSFQIIPTTAINQCTPVTLAWDKSAQEPVSIILAIPGGQSGNISITNVGRQDGGTAGFQWTPNVRAGTNVIIVANDGRGVGTGGSVNTVVGFSASNDQSCINGNSPSSTAGTPAGAIETGGSSSGSNNRSGSSTNVGAIVGGIVGGLAAVMIGALLAWFFLRRRNIRRHPVAHGVDLFTEGGQRDLDQPPEFYTPEPFVVPPSQVSNDDETTGRPSMSDRRYSAVSTTIPSESGLYVGNGAGTTSYAPSSNQTRKSRGGPAPLRPVNIVQHEDAGEIEEGPSQAPETIELPPSYTSVRK